MVICFLPKEESRVRFPYPAPSILRGGSRFLQSRVLTPLRVKRGEGQALLILHQIGIVFENLQFCSLKLDFPQSEPKFLKIFC